MRRWIAFSLVGALGVLIQLAVLTALTSGGLHYLLATVMAVEAAVLHNFAWHQWVTWRDRRGGSIRALLSRLSRFHAANGVVSLVGNVVLMAVLVDVAGLDAFAANLVAVGACSMINFYASDTMVFRIVPGLAVAFGALTLPASVRASEPLAELRPATLAAWQAYERKMDARYQAAGAATTFFALDDFTLSPGWRQRVMAGQIAMAPVSAAAPGAGEASVPDGKIHHWASAVFVKGTTTDGVLRALDALAGRESETYPDVLASRLIGREGGRLRVFLKLRRESVITVTYNTEHAVEYRRFSGARAGGRSASTRIAELADAGTPREREKPPGDDNGFLWRLNAYWRYEEVAGGVLIECESVSLSRSVPVLLRPFVSGTVDGIARESLERTMRTLRTNLTGRTP